MAYYPNWSITYVFPSDNATGVSIDLVELRASLTIFTTPTFDFGTDVLSTFISMEIATDVPVDSPTWSGSAGKTHNGRATLNDQLAGSTEYSHAWTMELNLGTWVSPTYSFTTVSDNGNGNDPPGKVTNPSPSHTATGVTLDEPELSWTTGADTDTFNIYFGESGSVVLVASGQDVLDENWAIDFGTLGYGIPYEWRVDSINEFGTTTGDTWTFTTLTFAPPVASGSNTMKVIKRLIAVARNKFWYENV